ncbi:ATP-binding cassette sub-family A member 13 [Eudromia elegans]
MLIQDRFQNITRMLSAINKGDCENMAYTNQNFFNTLESFLRVVQDTNDGSCECHLPLENIQEHLQMLTEILEPFSENPVVTLLSSFNLLNGVKVKDCVKNASELGLNIRSSVNVSEETISTVLEASISHSQVKIPSEIGTLLNTLLEVISSISSLLDKAQRVMENLPVFLQAVKDIGVLDISTFQQLLQGGQFRRSVVGSLESVIKAMCKEESSFFSSTNVFIDMPRITELLEDNMVKYGIPEGSTPFCLKLYQKILQSSNGALLWTFLKPLLHGKILYNSNIKMIDLVIKKANFTFAFVESLKTYSQTWLRMSEAFKNSGKGLVVSRLQEALHNKFIKQFIESHLNIDMRKLIEDMQTYETMMDKMLNSSATKQLDLLSQLLINISSCILLDRFLPFESVDQLEEKARELMQQNNFLASIIFNVPNNKTNDSRNLPQRISYTIRTSVLYSMRTDLIKNPMWKSHPQNLPADGFKYNHIFVPLQDMIERAIILVHTGTDTSEPAIQVQAMPYPCHTSDL